MISAEKMEGGFSGEYHFDREAHHYIGNVRYCESGVISMECCGQVCTIGYEGEIGQEGSTIKTAVKFLFRRNDCASFHNSMAEGLLCEGAKRLSDSHPSVGTRHIEVCDKTWGAGKQFGQRKVSISIRHTALPALYHPHNVERVVQTPILGLDALRRKLHEVLAVINAWVYNRWEPVAERMATAKAQ